MPSLIKQEDGSVRWDYDLPPEPKPAKKAVAKKAETEESK